MMDTVKINYQGTVFEVGEVRHQLADDPWQLAVFRLAEVIDNPHPIIEPEEPEITEEPEEPEPGFVCPVCGKTYTSERWYRKHVEGHDESIGD